MKFLYILLILPFLLFPTNTNAQQEQSRCDKREVVVEALKARYKEVPVVRGLTSNGSMMEVFSSPDGRTWTITMTQPNKMMCLVTGGEFLIDLFDNLKEKEKGQDINILTE